MNHQIRLAIDADILGDGYLQERFTAYVEVLGHFVRNPPRPLCVARMADMSGIPVAATRRYFRELGSACILQNLREVQDTWRLVKDPCDVTLEEVFRCAVAACSRRRRGAGSRAVPVRNRDIELLLLQALQTVDDHLYKSMRTYSLDRLMVSSATPFPVKRCRSVSLFTEVD